MGRKRSGGHCTSEDKRQCRTGPEKCSMNNLSGKWNKWDAGWRKWNGIKDTYQVLPRVMRESELEREKTLLGEKTEVQEECVYPTVTGDWTPCVVRSYRLHVSLVPIWLHQLQAEWKPGELFNSVMFEKMWLCGLREKSTKIESEILESRVVCEQECSVLVEPIQKSRGENSW